MRKITKVGLQADADCAATLAEIAAELGISHQRAWQLLQSGLEKLSRNPAALHLAQEFAEHREAVPKC